MKKYVGIGLLICGFLIHIQAAEIGDLEQAVFSDHEEGAYRAYNESDSGSDTESSSESESDDDERIIPHSSSRYFHTPPRFSLYRTDVIQRFAQMFPQVPIDSVHTMADHELVDLLCSNMQAAVYVLHKVPVAGRYDSELHALTEQDPLLVDIEYYYQQRERWQAIYATVYERLINQYQQRVATNLDVDVNDLDRVIHERYTRWKQLQAKIPVGNFNALKAWYTEQYGQDHIPLLDDVLASYVTNEVIPNTPDLLASLPEVTLTDHSDDVAWLEIWAWLAQHTKRANNTDVWQRHAMHTLLHATAAQEGQDALQKLAGQEHIREIMLDYEHSRDQWGTWGSSSLYGLLYRQDINLRPYIGTVVQAHIDQQQEQNPVICKCLTIDKGVYVPHDFDRIGRHVQTLYTYASTAPVIHMLMGMQWPELTTLGIIPSQKLRYTSNAEQLASVIRLTELPMSIGRFSKLTHLELGGHELTELPEEMLHLTSLEYLGLRSNKFTKVPTVACLATLKELNLSNNLITEVPWYIRCAQALEELDISYNRVTRVHALIGCLQNLHTLWLRPNVQTLCDLRDQKCIAEPLHPRIRECRKLTDLSYLDEIDTRAFYDQKQLQEYLQKL